MDTSQLPQDLQGAVGFHGHLCPGIMIGWRAAKKTAEFLGVTRSEDEELVAVVENDSCSVDAFQFFLSTTFGKGNLVWLDHGKQVFTVTNRKTGRAVRVSFIGDHLKKTLPDGSVDRRAFMETLLNASDQELLKVEEVKAKPPDMARVEPSVRCPECGEPVQKSRLVMAGGRLLCKPCAARENA